MLSDKARSYLPITKIIDEISFHHKDDAFLLQIADASALVLRYLLEERRDCEDLFEAFFTQQQFAARFRQEMTGNGGGYSVLKFTESRSRYGALTLALWLLVLPMASPQTFQQTPTPNSVSPEPEASSSTATPLKEVQLSPLIGRTENAAARMLQQKCAGCR
jgi:hypothetical protein